MEVLHCMPDEFLARYNARQIAEIMAYFRLKHEEREAEKSHAEIEMQRRALRGRRR